MGALINPGTVFTSDVSLGSVAVTNPNNAGASDDVYATAVLLLAQISNYLIATGFRFSIPLDAIVLGVTLNVERSGNALNATVDNSVRLVKGGVISGDNKASAVLWGLSDTVSVYGSNTDLWGLALTPADINASNFGAVVSTSAALAGTAQIDYISIQVDYLGSNRSGNMLRQIKSSDGISVSEGAS